jgi:hypothetical protein
MRRVLSTETEEADIQFPAKKVTYPFGDPAKDLLKEDTRSGLAYELKPRTYLGPRWH